MSEDTDPQILAAALRKFVERTHEADSQILSGSGPSIDRTELAVLRFLGLRGAARMKVLSEELNLSPSTGTYLIDKMIAKGLVRREPNAKDRRAILVTLETSGKRICDQATKAELELCEEMLAGFPEEDRERLVKVLDQLVKNGQPTIKDKYEAS